uniref:Uncharacterized protein n=1 Tax=Stomoxys calcitrans TaxID=35570 RepID=A0A1I8PLZ5_STOCA
MSYKLSLSILAVICMVATNEAASLRVPMHTYLDYEGVQKNVGDSRQAYEEDGFSGEDSDTEDEDDAERIHQHIIQQQQAQLQAVNDSQEGSEEDSEEEDDKDDEPSFLGHRIRRDVADAIETSAADAAPIEPVVNNEILDNTNPAVDPSKVIVETEESATSPQITSPPSSTSVLIQISDAINKVTTQLPNTEDVTAWGPQEYFQLFGYYLRQTIKQVLGDSIKDDDDDDDKKEETATIISESSTTAVDAEKEIPYADGDKDRPAFGADKEKAPMESKPVAAEIPPPIADESNKV